MRPTARIAALGIVASLTLTLAPAPAAHAGRYIGYKGRTDQGRRAQAVVRRTDRDRLFFVAFENGYELTCEDGTTQTWIVGATFFPGFRLRDHRRVHINEIWGNVAIHYNGRIGWLAGTGTTKWSVAALDPDEQAMLCTSDRQGWTLQRHGSAPAFSDGKDVALRIGYARVHVERDGTARLVRFRAPIAS